MNGNAMQIYNFFKSKGLSNTAIAGIMGNLQQESGLLSNNLQNTYNESLNISDKDYTNNVISGVYSKESFINDNAAYGLGQWKSSDRKAALYDFAKANNTTIDNLDTQLKFMWKEMEKEGIIDDLNACENVGDATYLFAKNFEKCTANMDNRKKYAEGFITEFPQEKPDINFDDFGNVGNRIQHFIDNNISSNILLKNSDVLTVETNNGNYDLYINGLKIQPENIESELTDIYLSELNPTEQVAKENKPVSINEVLAYLNGPTYSI